MTYFGTFLNFVVVNLLPFSNCILMNQLKKKDFCTRIFNDFLLPSLFTFFLPKTLALNFFRCAYYIFPSEVALHSGRLYGGNDTLLDAYLPPAVIQGKFKYFLKYVVMFVCLNFAFSIKILT